MAQIVLPNVVQDSTLQLWLDFSWPNSYTSYSQTVNTVNYSRKFNVSNLPYTSYANGAMTFDRTTSPSLKEGGGIQIEAYTNTALASTNFLYNDHTWEIWAKINDINPGNYDGTEGYSALANYRGYHAGYQYSATTMYYYVWTSAGGLVSPLSWTVATSGAQINQGSWFQIAVTRSTNTWQAYLNGSTAGASATQDLGREYTNTTNNLWIGKVGDYSPGVGGYVYYSKSSIAIMRMYTRALSAAEIQRNYQANRQRFGL